MSISSLLTSATNGVSSLLPSNTSSSLLPTTSTTPTTSGSGSGSPLGTSQQSITQNYTTFLQMLTTQLQNQDPTSPVDTNQFTQELVEFSGVEQQLQTNSQLGTLISLQQASQATAALSFVGHTVTYTGNTAQMTNSQAAWNLSASAPGTANVTIQSSTGQTVYSGTMSLNAGSNPFTWNGVDSSGTQWPAGAYTINVSATGANGQAVTVTTQSSGVVTGVNLSQSPAALTIGTQSIPISSITSITS